MFLRKSIVAQEGVWVGFTTTEPGKDLHRGHTSSQAQDSVTELFTDYLDLLFVIKTNVFKGRKGIGAHDFGPLVRVVGSRVSASKNMRKRTEEAILWYGDGVWNIRAGNISLDFENVTRFGVKVVVQLHVEASNVELSAGHHGGAKVLLVAKLLEHFFWEGFASLIVLSKAVDSGLVVAPVFHELGRKFDSIPLK